VAASFLLIEEYFATGDDRFVEAVRDFHVPGSLASIVDKWKKDPRPWARQQILKYLDLPLNAAGHETVIKRFFKHAEEARDSELIAAFAVAFDRLVRRQRRKRFHWDWQSRQSWQEEVLFAPRNALPGLSQALRGPMAPQFKAIDWVRRTDSRLFSYHTRYYLRRRVWRYLRRIGFARPDDYPAGVARLLTRYRNEDLAQGENILDSWALLHACFGKSDVLEFGASHVRLRNGRALRELVPAPEFPELWRKPPASRVLMDLLLGADSRLVRVWAIGLLRQQHAEVLSAMPVADLRRLLDHADEEVQLLGAQLLEGSSQLDKLPVSDWLDLLSVRNPLALETICRLMAQHVRSERLDLRQCVQLACAAPVPVARLGFGFLRNRENRSEAELETIANLSGARCARIGQDLATWALARLGTTDAYRADRVTRFFDSLLREVRDGAWSWLTPESRGWDNAALWSRLVETPYDDARLHFVSALRQRSKAPGLVAGQLSSIWCGVLLGIHRGGRHKLTALRQISDAVQDRPDAADTLLPVLAVAIRSVRPPEARGGLAAIVAAVEARPELAPLVARVLPELELSPQGVAS